MQNSKAVSKLVLIGVPVLVGIVSLIIVLVVFRPFAPSPRVHTWTVDDDGPADFDTIREAVNAAKPEDTIFVKAGTYSESYIEVTKALTLSGENKSTTIIDGKGIADAVISIKANNVSLSEFTIRNGAGIYIGEASECTVKNNLITSNIGGSGIDLYRSSNNIVSDNIIVSNPGGIELSWSSNNNTINNNMIVNNGGGVYLEESSTGNTFSANTIANNSVHGVYYYSYYGEAPCDNNALIGNTIANNSRGVLLEYCHNNMVIDNVISNNTEFGINSFYSSGSFVGNRLSNNGECSIAITGTSGNNISRNIISNSEEGIDLYESSNNIVEENMLLGNQYAIYIWTSSDNNLVYENTISNNDEGIHLAYSSGNIIYHNNFINNTMQVYCEESINAWDDGYPSGGNYWSDHICAGNPSDGSQLYTIDADNLDHYPFQDPDGWLP